MAARAHRQLQRPAGTDRQLVARFLAGLLLLPFLVSVVTAQSARQLLQAQIGAGEFAPALATALAADDPRQRDTWLGQIALAQATAGDREASLHTASEIYDDRSRAEVISSVASQPLGGWGGAGMADFDSLIELITSTVQPTSWDTVGGPGSIASFPSGVYIDAQGLLRPLLKREGTGSLSAVRASSMVRGGQQDVRRNSPLRMVSLPRLEKQVQLRLAAGRQPTEAMQLLAGLTRVKYVLVYPAEGDLVLAGPAGAWTIGDEDRVVGAESGQPVLRLDDLVVVLRQMFSAPEASFGCLITPRRKGLARVQALAKQPTSVLGTEQRRQWVEQLRAALGTQDIEVYGIDPSTRAAAVMIEADYRMKLVGMGLEAGVPGVESYLDMVTIAPGEAPPPMGVLRWWFTVDYQAVRTSSDRLAFGIDGQGLKVLSENELLTEHGERIHTGETEELNRRFAQSFSEHFQALSEEYPVYAELRNLADLALACALIREEDLAAACRWHMTCFGDSHGYRVQTGAAPSSVETVANYRVIRSGNAIHTLVGVSGGVRIDPTSLVSRDAVETDRYGTLDRQRAAASVKDVPHDAWWWD